jgi:hypothetical protein
VENDVEEAPAVPLGANKKLTVHKCEEDGQYFQSVNLDKNVPNGLDIIFIYFYRKLNPII